MANTDPPNEVDDGKSPAYGYVDAPDTGAFVEKPANGHQHHIHDAERHEEPGEPPERGAAANDNGADLFRDGRKSMARLNHREHARLGYVFTGALDLRTHECSACCLSDSFPNFELGFVTSARYVVRGRVFSSASIA